MHVADLGLRLPAWPPPLYINWVTPNPHDVSRKALLDPIIRLNSSAGQCHTLPTQPPRMCGRR